MRTDSSHRPEPTTAAGRRAAIIVSRYHTEITDRLEAGAREAFLDAGGLEANLVIVPSPGAFELVSIASAWIRRKEIDLVVTLGCIVTGETRHDRYLAAAVADGLANLSADCAKPVAFGVLTVSDLAQARDRCGGPHGHKGRESMDAALAAARAIDEAALWRASGSSGGGESESSATSSSPSR